MDTTNSDADRPGDDDPEPRVGRGRAAPSGQAVYHARITVKLPDRMRAPSVSTIEATVAVAIAHLVDPSVDDPIVHVDATRTDI